jgi:hypothetical protein
MVLVDGLRVVVARIRQDHRLQRRFAWSYHSCRRANPDIIFDIFKQVQRSVTGQTCWSSDLKILPLDIVDAVADRPNQSVPSEFVVKANWFRWFAQLLK